MSKEAIAHYEAALKEAFPSGATGDVFHHWNEARKALEEAQSRSDVEKQSAEHGEPVAFDFQKALKRAYYLGQNYWADADSESYSANKRADKHRQDFDALCEQALAYTTPPTAQRQWVGLTDEEVDKLDWGPRPDEPMTFQEGLRDFYRAIEAKLKEKMQ